MSLSHRASMVEPAFGSPPAIPPNGAGLLRFLSDFYSGTLAELPRGVRGIFRASRGWTIQVPLRHVPSLPGFVRPPRGSSLLAEMASESRCHPCTGPCLSPRQSPKGGELCRSAIGLSQAMAVPRSPVGSDIPTRSLRRSLLGAVIVQELAGPSPGHLHSVWRSSVADTLVWDARSA